MIALALAFGAQRGKRNLALVTHAADVSALTGKAASYTLYPTAGRLEIASKDAKSRLDVEMSLVVDGVERPLAMRRADVHTKDKSTLTAEFPIELGGEERATGSLELRMDPSSDFLAASLAVTQDAGTADHTYALRFGLAPEGRNIFIPGVGEPGDISNLTGRTLILDDDVHPFAFSSTQGALTIDETEPDTAEAASARPRLVVSGKAETATKRAPGAKATKPARLDIGILVASSNQAMWGRVNALGHVPTAKITGVVTGTREVAHVYGLDDEGHPQVRVVTDPSGRFVLDAPTSAVQWYAALEAVHASAPVKFTPGTPWDLRLDIAAGGELEIKVTDGDTHQPLLARLIIKGLDGTLDPSFGPDYRASGAGPLMDLIDGHVKTPLPAGKYRVSATKGIEWSIDSSVIEIGSGHTKLVELAPRHVVPTPGMVGCDLHVHARPSFDSPVTAEDRVLSLISAGIDFAVPTEHNVVGNYAPALEVQHLSKQLAHVTGVEITTYNPRFGHFGAFPYPPGGVPPYKGTSVGAMAAAARRSMPNGILQINHPRLLMNIGYFNIINFDPKNPRSLNAVNDKFDSIEVYNGYELSKRELTEHVMDDWYSLMNTGRHIVATGSSDSHRIQYQWAGYPRTMAVMDTRAAGDTGGAIDTKEVVASLKKGRSFVTSGPMVDFELAEGGRSLRPGDETGKTGAMNGHLRVRAAPWIDVTSVEIIAGVPPTNGKGAFNATTSLFKAAVPSRPSTLGKEEGRLDEAHARTLRYDADFSIRVPDGAKWVIAIVRGERAMDDALPFMPIQPLAFTNPVWITR